MLIDFLAQMNLELVFPKTPHVVQALDSYVAVNFVLKSITFVKLNYPR